MEKMHDVIILVPGITGSTLKDADGKDLWAPSGQALWRVLRDGRELFEQLKLKPHAPGAMAPDDGVRAHAVIDRFHGIFGLWKIDGYTDIVDLVRSRFEVRVGSIHDPHDDENFFAFPYDWRRSNRESAEALARFATIQLERWKAWSHWKTARVILLAHSMGGLVARHYLERLEGWRTCRGLVTFGTPFRGSLDALGYLSNGFPCKQYDVSSVMSSMPSLYELLPIYEAVKEGKTWRRASELLMPPLNLDMSRVRDALHFHRDLEASATRNRLNDEYLDRPYAFLPVVGTSQPTFQSARLNEGALSITHEVPPVVDEGLRGGDGRVPRISATPIDMHNRLSALHVAERHTNLQNHAHSLEQLLAALQELEVDPDAPPVRGGVAGPKMVAIGLEIAEMFGEDAPFKLRAHWYGQLPKGAGLRAEISSAEGGKSSHPLVPAGDAFELELTPMPAGQYRVRIVADNAIGPSAPTPVHEVFEVAPNS